MRYLYVASRLFLFLAVLGFSLKNTHPVTMYYYLGMNWSAPLALMLLIVFCVGALAGIGACLSLLITQRRNLRAMQQELQSLQSSRD
jgi:lipopolysaccharide assembly protein A